MKIQFLFAWYDLWIGAFYDKERHWWYILPFPTVGIILKLPQSCRITTAVSRVKAIFTNWRDRKELARKRTLLTVEFQKLNWSKDQVIKMTINSCSCLDEAIVLLANRLMNHCSNIDGKMNDGRLFKTAKELVRGGFEKGWS